MTLPFFRPSNIMAASFTRTRALGEAARQLPKRRCAVTGGSGKLGRSVVQRLSDDGWEVINVDYRRPKTASEDGKTGIQGAYRVVEIDLSASPPPPLLRDWRCGEI